MEDDDGNDVKRIMRDVLDTPATSDWSVTGPSIRQSARSRWTRFVPSSSLIAAAAVIVALVTSLVLISTFDGGSRHRSALSAGSPGAGTTPGTTPTPGTSPSDTSVPSSNGSTTLPTGSSTTTLPVTTTTGAPVVGPKSLPGSCAPTPSPMSVSVAPATACVAVGSVLSVTFTEVAAYGGPLGGWLGGPTSTDPAVVAVDSSSTNGSVLSAQIRGVSQGTATVTVDFHNECSSGITTPCTIPPLGQESLTVQVTN